jgi:APA family basic amino acid/polyamine antiporter
MATSTSQAATSQASSPELVKGLRLYDCTTIVMGSMIGSGIFIVAAEIAREVQSPGLLLLCWVVSGVMTVAAA